MHTPMTVRARIRAALVATLVTVPLASVLPAGPPAAAEGPLASSVALDWQRTAIRTIFAETTPTPPPPVGAVYLSFTSIAVYDAVRHVRGGTAVATAAVATAAHDVLYQYFPASRANLDADLADSLALVPDGDNQDLGVEIGAAAAERMITSRVGDGRGDASVVYSKAPGIGVWQPPATGMAIAWLAFMRPVVDVPAVVLDGPDPVGSAAYATDYEEVRTMGPSTGSARTPQQTAIAQFFMRNPILEYRDALCRYLDEEPMGLLPTTRLFARIDAAQVTTFIRTWRLKYDVGFWRPFQAIAQADVDGNPDTTSQLGWAPLVPNPAYSDYTSGHAAATAPFAAILRQAVGDDLGGNTPLVLRSGGQERTYTSLTALEHDALHARIWGGLHFRDAMEDGYLLGHTVADLVMREVR